MICNASFDAGHSDKCLRVRGSSCWHAEHLLRLRIAEDALRAPCQDGHSLVTRSIDQYTPLEVDSFSGVRLSQLWRIE